YILLAICIALAAFLYSLRNSLDYGRVVYNHRPGLCTPVHGIVNGSEDIELIQSEGIAFVTSGVTDRLVVDGKVFLYDFNQRESENKLTELPIIGDSFDQVNFHPHGLSHWIVNGVIRLYVISHSDENEHSIQVREIKRERDFVANRGPFPFSVIFRPNGIVAVGPDQFIITNDGTAQNDLVFMGEILVGYRGASVVSWDGKESHKLLSGLYGSNGIAYDPRRNTLFVTELCGKTVLAYQLARDMKTATLISSIHLKSGCDNIFLSPDGSLYIGCHPIMHETAVALFDCLGNSTSASQILHVKYNEDYTTADVTEPYSNDGKEQSGSSVAVVYEKQILIGSVCRGLLHCKIAESNAL
ncbi:hypothetical protein PMAYCL1PPCAC_04603, partial [Pristionchus mayeri]